MFDRLFKKTNSTIDTGNDESYDAFAYFRDHLIFRAEHHKTEYSANQPFPHVVMDDFLPEHLAQRVLDRFPTPEFEGYEQPDNEHQVNKLGRLQASQFKGVDEWLRNTVHHFNSVAFINFLQLLTGISGLIPDPYFNGGAFHQILPGGKLDVHADFNVDVERLLRRRINVLVYFNKDWNDDYKGNLELWDRDLSACQQSIAPLFNRAVIFNTTSDSYHGHPEILCCPSGTTRKSLAFYYYTADEDVFKDQFAHNTLWRET
ncbi:MAG: 2OG-Fe(II) oxygenase [Pseudomonadota bacterium]